jgi:hypothetical protein
MINYPCGWFDPKQLPKIKYICIIDLDGKDFWVKRSEYQQQNSVFKNIFKLK